MSSFQGSIFTKDLTNKKTLSRWAYFISRKPPKMTISNFLDFLHILGWTIDIIWTAQLLDWDMLLTMTNQLYPLILIYIRMASLEVFCLLWVPICISYMYLWTIKYKQNAEINSIEKILSNIPRNSIPIPGIILTTLGHQWNRLQYHPGVCRFLLDVWAGRFLGNPRHIVLPCGAHQGGIAFATGRI